MLPLESRIGGHYHLATPTTPTTFIPAILQSCFPRGMRLLCYSESSGAFGVQSALIWPAFHQVDWDCTTATFPCCCTALYTYCDCHICFPYCMYCICMLEMPCDVSHYLFFNAMYFYIDSPFTILFLFHAM